MSTIESPQKLQFRTLESNVWINHARKNAQSCAMHLRFAAENRAQFRELTAAMHESIAVLDAKQAASDAFMAHPELREVTA